MIRTLTLSLAALAFFGAPAQAKYEALHSFCATADCKDGAEPWGLPATDGAGHWYGMTQTGGLAGDGTVYELSYNGTRWIAKRIHSFCAGACRDGSTPRGSLVVDTAGALYGMASTGGAGNQGTIFKMTPDGSGGWSFATLHAFCTKTGCPDGARPAYSSLSYQGQSSGALYDGTSPLYGTTQNGGTRGQGVVFRLVPGGAYKVLHQFCSLNLCADGGQSYSPVTVDAMGHIFGNTTGGGAYNHGAVFELAPKAAGYKYTVLHSFCAGGGFCADGDSAIGPMTMTAGGDLVGTTFFGGAHAQGAVFKLTPAGAASPYSVVHSFCATTGCPDGANPRGALAIDATGRLFGTTYGGGAGNMGTLYKLVGTDWSTHTVIRSFGTAGSYPQSGVAVGPGGVMAGTTLLGGGNDKGVFFQYTP